MNLKLAAGDESARRLLAGEEGDDEGATSGGLRVVGVALAELIARVAQSTGGGIFGGGGGGGERRNPDEHLF